MTVRFVWATPLSLVVASAALAQTEDAADPTILAAEEAEAVLVAGRAALEDPTLEAVPGHLLVGFVAGTELGVQSQIREAVGAQLVRTLDGTGTQHLVVDIATEDALAILRALPMVEFAEPDWIVRPLVTPNDTYYSLQYGLHNTGQSIRGINGIPDADIDAPAAWDTLTGDASFVIAVIDSGVQWSHPDLNDNIWSNPGEVAGNGVDDDGNGYVDDVHGWDFDGGDNNPDDGDGHGTHVAGTIAAEGNNGQGVTGVLWDAQIMPLRFIGPFGGSTSDAILAIEYAVDNGATISNNSWGGGGFSTALRNAIQSAASADHLFVAAAGNSGQNADSSPMYPAAYDVDNIVSVAALDNRDGLASFSNYGPVTVDLGAPGVDIASTYSGNGYVWLSGTSMASPHVAGVAGAVRIQNPGWTYAQVRDQLLATVRPVSSIAGLTVTGGAVNMEAALAGGGGDPDNTPPVVGLTAPANGPPIAGGASLSFTGTASDAEDGALSGAIAWSSSLDGLLGTGASINATLSVGTHLVTASVTDADGATASDAITVTVEADDPAPTRPPARVDRAAVTDLGGGSARIDWNDVATETSYEIERMERVGNSRQNKTTIATVGADVTSYVDDPGFGRWRYRVRGVNEAGNGQWSRWRARTLD